ncbi:chemotaxis protein CheD [Pseudobacillus wudalianchiensis]|uniref:Probable chemoreceptor glutamine deamidase CheD n=1 Tax=Pseudobacillus wudalianchiensis TaxID=1743143 RepID=A0A1B9AIY3_9BACI|nr:chemotaxis protein CheD [Bacillus wudalianchiensis]OCA83815.1 chemotaxis protein CheD [Bacillus wudalianchiensis]
MSSTGQIVKVGIADLNIVRPPHVIRTSGLGSCVGVVIYDERASVAGMVHVMLPDSALAKSGHINKAKYADTGINELIALLKLEGAQVYRLKAKIAGGAQMFQFSSQNSSFKIGPRNVEAVKQMLQTHHIPIVAEDVGGNSGRTIEFDPHSCELQIRTVNKGSHII